MRDGILWHKDNMKEVLFEARRKTCEAVDFYAANRLVVAERRTRPADRLQGLVFVATKMAVDLSCCTT